MGSARRLATGRREARGGAAIWGPSGAVLREGVGAL